MYEYYGYCVVINGIRKLFSKDELSEANADA